MEELEHNATDHSTRISELLSESSHICEWQQHRCEDLKSRKRMNNIHLLSVLGGEEGPAARLGPSHPLWATS